MFLSILCCAVVCLPLGCGGGGSGESAEPDVSESASPGDSEDLTVEDLITAAGDGDLALVRAAVEAGLDVNSADEYGITPLMQSVAGANVELVDYLINAGADVNMQDSDGYSALLHAIDAHGQVAGDPELSADYWQIMRLLVEAGADVNVRDSSGETAVSLARSYADSENGKTVELLMELGATE